MMKNDEAALAPTQRIVHQPTNGGPRHPLRLLPGAPTFQEFVNESDARGTMHFLSYLRDEYFSIWGTN